MNEKSIKQYFFLEKVCFFIFILMFSLSSFAISNTNKVIYGIDDREEVYNVKKTFRELAKSTAAMISNRSLKDTSKGIKISGSTLEDKGMCKSERFSNQITAARCSGFLIGDDLLVTAGHCVRGKSDCKNYAWVFDYKIDPYRSGMYVGDKDVYACDEIIGRELDSKSRNDYAVIKLDRPVYGRRPLEFRKRGLIPSDTHLVVIGHPSGLPTKVADNASVRENVSSKVYFVANLDTYGGNSGSAVFNTKTRKVEGILVRGENDYNYNYNKGCYESNVCVDSECRGEDVTRITAVKELFSRIIGLK